ncbi:winged helix-turn-helix domain-containing protein [Frateuria aurantia]|uniref:Molybdenum-binding protein n=1 Tax=Frateuria aurantia (strain ATCC 33424 / DSM 6220 / KCTC 2777 / LMG 1558 / NBRC 3245 / NCIMB 13370) TaxID=767434 RepID=H8KY96_FRAAD|nr:LysR family transcriptional regulator [Frateuria aurantia]AFC86090.1 molybdenum-binding protein [Frateuria aurantia DSM 6220]
MTSPLPQLSIRIVFGEEDALGKGKIQLLERIAETGSISAAARSMDMSYRRAWQLLEALNHTFGRPLAQTRKGGNQRGGATLTPAGITVCETYRRLQARAATLLADELTTLSSLRLPGAS